MKKSNLISEIRESFLRSYYGTLSTLNGPSPYGSLARYSIDQEGQAIFLLSRIAQHTKNIQKNNHVSLFVINHDHPNIQECSRVSLLGSMEVINQSCRDFEACLFSYTAYYPESKIYLEQLDFDLYRLQISECTFIGGFGAAHKISGSEFRQVNPLDFQTQQGIISHMNKYHRDAILHYCNVHKLELNGQDPVLVALDANGFQLRIGTSIERILFSKKIHDSTGARDAFVEMARS